MRDIGVDTWLAHGTLLGWWWNESTLPWDGDLDMQLSFESLEYLAENFNMTTYSCATESNDDIGSDTATSEQESVGSMHEYLLDVNPNYTSRGRGNWQNIIDARWIDVSNGLFIDITGLSEVMTGIWSCKNQHRYSTEELYPLIETKFEGVTAMIPAMSEAILIEEYESTALEIEQFGG